MIRKDAVEQTFAKCVLATDFSAIEAFGYSVTLSGNPELPYQISGPRNVRYALMRNVPTPTLLFAVYDRPGKFGVAKVHGYAWFREKNGKLEPC